MFLYSKMAWRNITRNLRRTMITLTAIAFGLAAVIIFFGFTDGFHAQWIENSVKVYSGHILIYAAGYREENNLNRNIKDVGLIEDRVSDLQSLVAFTTRIHIQGLASTAESSRSVLIRGIDPKKEAEVTALDKRIIEGEYLQNDTKGGILLGHTSAKKLNARIGDKVVLMIQAADGSIGAELFRLQGIFRIGAVDLDKFLAVITVKDAQKLAVLGNSVTEAVLIVDQPGNVLPVARRLKSKLEPQGYEVISWHEYMPQAKEMIDLSSAFMYVILVIVLIVVSLGILNTMLMSIMERTRELGIMMALGTKPRQIVALVMLESFFLGLIGIVLGMGIGIGSNWLIALKGFDLSGWAGAMDLVASLRPVIYPDTNFANVCLATVTTFLTTLLVSVYPAIKAAGLKPVEAIHFV